LAKSASFVGTGSMGGTASNLFGCEGVPEEDEDDEGV
jgi:hypothetical protein